MADHEPPRDVLRMERTFAAPPATVFDAWTSTEALRLWWPAGPGWETPVADVDLRVGGRLRLVMRAPDGVEFGGEGIYLEITRPSRLVFTWRWDGGPLEADAQRVEVTFSANPDSSTTVVLVNRGLTPSERESHHDGWQASFDNLDHVLAHTDMAVLTARDSTVEP